MTRSPHFGLVAGLLVAPPVVAAVDAGEALPTNNFAADFGQYAPGGDCGRQPLIVVVASGLTITVDGENARHAARRPARPGLLG